MNRLFIIAYFHFSPQKKKKNLEFSRTKKFSPMGETFICEEKEEEDFDYKSTAHCRIFPSFPLKKKLEFSRTKKFSPTSEKEEEEKTSIINRSLIVACFHFFPSKIWNFREQKNLFAKKKRKKTSIINRLLIVACFHLSPQKKKKNRNFREQKNFRPRSKNLFARNAWMIYFRPL